MIFTSLDFAIFLPVVFLLYWFAVKGHLKIQNTLIVVASYIFYGWWDWRFLSLIFISTVLDYSVGYVMNQTEHNAKRKLLLITSIVVNLGILGFFKYYNFFVENFVEAFSFFGVKLNWHTLDVILPVGISFYTFQTMSYTIDIYRKKIEPTKDFIAFSAFVSFFPQLVAGPIERARDLLPQFYVQRSFDYDKAVDGMRQILWGVFKKVVIADNLAQFVNVIFENPSDFAGSSLLLGGIFFTIQIYADFSGYSDIAIGTARLFGFHLSRNFNFPFFAQSIPELWRRWHITLTSWLYEAVFTPLSLAFRDYGKFGLILAFYIHLILIGFWHGANWTFIVFGAFHGTIFLPYILRGTIGKKKKMTPGLILPTFKGSLNMSVTFMLFMFSCIIFRAENMGHAMDIFKGIFNESIIATPSIVTLKMLVISAFTFVLFAMEWVHRDKQHGLQLSPNSHWGVRYSLYFIITLTILWLRGGTQDFIYFQF